MGRCMHACTVCYEKLEDDFIGVRRDDGDSQAILIGFNFSEWNLIETFCLINCSQGFILKFQTFENCASQIKLENGKT